METLSTQPKPRWVKLTQATLAISVLGPILLSLVFHKHYQFWQLVLLAIAGVWLIVFGFFTITSPVAIARWFGRPGAYEILVRDGNSAGTRWYFSILGAFFILLGLAVAGAAIVMLQPPTPAVHA